MHILDTIKTRRTHFKFLDQEIPREVLERALEAAIWAPNHKLTEPWYFYVLAGDSKKHLAELRYEVVLSVFENEARAQKARQEMQEAPVIIVVTQTQSEDVELQLENTLSVGAAVQNFLLALWHEGVGSYWGTGPLTKSDKVYKYLDIPDTSKVVGILFLGYPARQGHGRRTPWQDKTTFLT